VDDYEFGIEREAVQITLLVFAKDFEVARLRMIRRAMKGIVEGLGDREEIFASGNDIPMEGKVQIFRERNEPIEDFGNAATNGSGIHHLDAASLQRTSQGS
jgi:hypothetical protein